MDLDTFLSELARLERELGRGDENLASFQCEGCQRCASCMFCTDCTDCYKCTHCEGSQRCSACSHCVGCERCHDCAYCRHCVRCQGSSYLVHCRDCVDCTYCYGCVGLIKKEFQILNVRYPRKEYFEITAKLDEERKRRAGHAPPSRPPTAIPAAVPRDVPPGQARPPDTESETDSSPVDTTPLNESEPGAKD